MTPDGGAPARRGFMRKLERIFLSLRPIERKPARRAAG
jgi:hypothetical protein